MSSLQFGVLGALQVSADGTALPLGTPKQRAVLAKLLINRNRPVSVDALVSAAWDESPPPGARASLHSYVSNLRKLLATGGYQPLVSAPPGYRLDVAGTDCDLDRFVAARADGVRAAAEGRFELAGRYLTEALALWRGPALEDLHGLPFVDPFAAALAEDRLAAHTARIEAAIACGRAHTVIAELEALTAENRYHEPLWTQLVTAYYLSQRQTDALNTYHRLQTTLADELGIDPGPSIRALYTAILRQEQLDVVQSARSTATGTVTQLEQRTALDGRPVQACLVDSTGARYPLVATATRIGRLTDNDIVLAEANVSRHHAVIVDTGTSFVITDLRSANGLDVGHERVRGSATLNHGDHIRICDHSFTFEIAG